MKILLKKIFDMLQPSNSYMRQVLTISICTNHITNHTKQYDKHFNKRDDANYGSFYAFQFKSSFPKIHFNYLNYFTIFFQVVNGTQNKKEMGN